MIGGPDRRLIALGNEQPGQRIGARRKVTLNGTQFVASFKSPSLFSTVRAINSVEEDFIAVAVEQLGRIDM